MENDKFNLEPKEMKDSDKKRNLQEKLKKIIFRKDSKSRKLSENLDDSMDIKNNQNIKNQKTEKQNELSNHKEGKINEKIIFFKNKNLHKEKEDLNNNIDLNKIRKEKYNKLEEEKSDIIKPFESNKNKRNNSLSNDSSKDEALKILQLLKKKKSEKEFLELKENEAKKEAFQNDINNKKYIPKINSYKYATSNLNKKKKKFIYENSNNPEEKNRNIFFNKNNEQIGLTKKNYFRNVINISFNKYYNSNNIELLKPNNDFKDEKIGNNKNICYNNKDKDNHILNKNKSESKINNYIYTNKNFSNNYNKNKIFKRNVSNNLNSINISTKNMLNERNQNIIRSIDVNSDYYLSNDSKKVYTPKKTYIRLGKSKEKNIFHKKINKRNLIPIGIDYFTNANSFNNIYYKNNNSPKKIINYSLGEKQIELNSPNTYYDYNSINSNFGIYENDSKVIQNENKKIYKTRVLIRKKVIHNKNKSQLATKNINKMNNIYNNYYSNNISNKKEVKNNNTKYYNYIKKKIPNNSLDKEVKQNKNIQNKIMKVNKDKISFNIQYVEELLILDDKFNLIITKIDSAESKSISNECFDFLNYFYNSVIYLNFDQIMNDSENYEIINLFIKYILLSIILCYDLSLDSDTINMHLKLSEILEINYKSFITILEMIYDKIDIENNNDNFWINNLSNLINNWKYLNETEINILNKKNISKIESININIKLVNSKIEYIIVNYSKSLNKCLNNLFKKINDKSIEDINYFYREYILREENLGCSILASSYLKELQNFTPEKVPYIRDMNKKKFTLVLDLEETLVHFKIEENYEEGILKLRPGVLQFLDQVSQYYELVLFSEASQEYSDLILEAFEENKKYFDYKLYRQHTVIKNQDFIKDLTRLGRPLNTIIIVDNMPQNFRLQNMNGIPIKPFRGEDINDRALFDLSTILINIAKEYSDVRNGLVHYHQEIVTKIVSNIYKHYK